MMEKLKVINLAKSYDRDVPVLRDISFCVDDRDFFVILGPSGCGKTTLLNIIAGVEDINGGEIYIDGIRVNENKPQKRDVAMVFQNYALYPTMNVFDNIAFPLRNRHFKKKEIIHPGTYRSRQDDGGRISGGESCRGRTGRKDFLSDGQDDYQNGGKSGIRDSERTGSEDEGHHIDGKRKNLFL